MTDRRRRGAAAPNAKLSARDVEDARARHALGEGIGALAQAYGCCYKTMWRLLRDVTYREERA